MTKRKNPHAVALGRIGGKAKGGRKRRSPEFYQLLSKLGVLARQEKKSP